MDPLPHIPPRMVLYYLSYCPERQNNFCDTLSKVISETEWYVVKVISPLSKVTEEMRVESDRSRDFEFSLLKNNIPEVETNLSSPIEDRDFFFDTCACNLVVAMCFGILKSREHFFRISHLPYDA